MVRTTTLGGVLIVVLGGCASTSTGGSGDQGAGHTKNGSGHRARVFAHASASGDYAIAQASGNVNDPGKIRVLVSAKPTQSVQVSWSVACTRGTGAGTKSGQFTAPTPTRRAVKIPMRNPNSCIVSANAQLAKSGKVLVRLRG